MKKRLSFTAVILDAGGGGAYVEVPFDVEKELGSKRPKIKATIEGIPYRGILTRMGTECHLLIVLKSIREQSGKTFGDEISVTVEPDPEERVVQVPEELRKALSRDKKAQAFFGSLSYTHRKEYVTYLTEAKREETRVNRLARIIEMLKEGQRGV